jgi:hypothetical protein
MPAPMQLLVWLKSLASVPVTATVETVSTALLLMLFTVTLMGELLVPTACDGKITLVGDIVTPGADGVVFNEI